MPNSRKWDENIRFDNIQSVCLISGDKNGWKQEHRKERRNRGRKEELSGEVEDSFRAALPHSVIRLLASQCHHPGDLYGGLEAYVNNKERPYVYLIKSESCYFLSFSECLIGHCNWQLTVITCWVVNTAGISTLSCAASNHNQVTEGIWKIHKIILLQTHFNILTCKLECSSQGLSHWPFNW